MITCSRCGVPKPEDDFHRDRSRPNGRVRICRPCNTITVREWRRANPGRAKSETPEARRVRRLRTVYGLTPDDFERMSDAQGGRCAICRRARTLVIDHCHESGAVRGLLCNPCNLTLGYVQDSTDVLAAAVAYLKDHS